MASLPTAADFEKEALQASNLYITAQNIRDKGASDSMAKITTTQYLDLDKEKHALEKELQSLKGQLSAFERDFLDQRAEKGEVIAGPTLASSLQDSALSVFAFAWIVFVILLLTLSAGTSWTLFAYRLISLLFVSLLVWGLIFNYA